MRPDTVLDGTLVVANADTTHAGVERNTSQTARKTEKIILGCNIIMMIRLLDYCVLFLLSFVPSRRHYFLVSRTMEYRTVSIPEIEVVCKCEMGDATAWFYCFAPAMEEKRRNNMRQEKNLLVQDCSTAVRYLYVLVMDAWGSPHVLCRTTPPIAMIEMIEMIRCRGEDGALVIGDGSRAKRRK